MFLSTQQYNGAHVPAFTTYHSRVWRLVRQTRKNVFSQKVIFVTLRTELSQTVKQKHRHMLQYSPKI